MKARRHSVADQTEPNAVRFGPSSDARADARPSAHDKGAEASQGFGWREINPPVGCKQARPSSKPFAASAISPGPFRGWGPESSGVHPHTKGARCSAGGHRHGIPSAQGASSRLARRQGVRKPLMTEARHTDQGNGGGRDSWSNDLLAPSPDGGQTGRAHRCRRRRALWSPARCGTFASPPVKWPARQGEARIRTPWRQRAACAVRCAGPSGTRSATCPCSPGSASRTRTRRSCPCAAASVCRTAGRPAPAAA